MQHTKQSDNIKAGDPVNRMASRVLDFLWRITPGFLRRFFLYIDSKIDGGLSFFFKHYGKTKFMIAMSKRAQYLGIEKLYNKGPKAFVYFFLFYLVRDTILYIIIPIYIARMAN